MVLQIFLLAGCSTFQSQPRERLYPHYAPVKNGQIEYYRIGHGSPVVLLPGYLTDVTSWNRQFIAALAKQHQVIILNNRNVGGSIVKSTHYESKDLANDTYQLIKATGLRKPAVIGISMGGMIAQQLAVLHGKDLGQLILINTVIAGKQAIHPAPVIENKMFNMPTSQLGRYVVAVDVFFPPQWRMKMAYSLIADRFLPDSYTEINPAPLMTPQRNLVTHWIDDNATAKKIRALHLPVLILNGEADMVLPPANSIILAKTIPHAELVRWKEGGHAMIYQYPDQLARAINIFIAEA